MLLRRLKKSLSEHRHTAPLFDSERWVRNFESGLEEVWTRYHEQSPSLGADVWVRDVHETTKLRAPRRSLSLSRDDAHSNAMRPKKSAKFAALDALTSAAAVLSATRGDTRASAAAALRVTEETAVDKKAGAALYVMEERATAALCVMDEGATRALRVIEERAVEEGSRVSVDKMWADTISMDKQRTATYSSSLQDTTTAHCNTLQHAATHSVDKVSSNKIPTANAVAVAHVIDEDTSATQCSAPQPHCNSLQHTATHKSSVASAAAVVHVPEEDVSATQCNPLQHTATDKSVAASAAAVAQVPAEVAEGDSKLVSATHCNTRQHTAAHGNTLQAHCAALHHTAPHCTTHEVTEGDGKSMCVAVEEQKVESLYFEEKDDREGGCVHPVTTRDVCVHIL